MGLLDTLDSLAGLGNSGVLPVARSVTGTFDAVGKYIVATPTTFTVTGIIEPATGFSRVVGGQDMISDEQGQHTNDVRVLYTATQLFPRTPTNDPDLITYQGVQWTVFRVEKWDLTGQVLYRVLFTRETDGAS